MDEDDYLRDLMLAVDVPPTTADIGLAIATGRRQARRGTIVAGAAAAALVVAAGTTYALGVAPTGGGGRGVQAGPPTDASYADCTVDQLEVTGPAGIPAVDPAGRVIVGTVGGTAVRFDNGRTVPYPGATGQVVAVNNAGVIVGYDEVDQASHGLAWTYHNGTKTMLAKLAGYDYSFPTAVNARGDVVGAAMGEANDDTVPVIWPADRPGTVRALAMPAGYGEPNTGGSQAVGLTDDGHVVGNVRGAPTRWSPDGTPALLPTPPGHEYATVTALRGAIVFGMAAVTGENRVVAIRWDLGLDQVTVLVGVPYDVTDGTPGGWAITTGGDYNQPTRVTPQRTVEQLPLPPGVLLPPNGPGAVAYSISDDGRTITGATATDGNRRPLIWHC
ncbi:hypothetical protein AB0K00_47540 [Dactylosporangium sp. NPDC049525]|uniref:hypothetical protein n=1 Tax=Dactylosporangium sp. NPDC049525 TaxID=3154730 RepID=UPI00342E5DFE